ncbi:60S acidic [Carex littledalei]|uniref:60S acidic n=1 Tax=Carex littledalei TaxID=544730 RepID=A0A833VDG4_9POAL|nr:60S acidic [Carex littledalei]
MKVIAAYLLLALGVYNQKVKTLQLTLFCFKNIIVGAESDKKRIEFLLSELKGKDLAEVIAAGREKFASVPSGGGVAVAAAAPAAGGGGAAPAAAEAKKEEKVEEKEESDDDMGFSLFD